MTRCMNLDEAKGVCKDCGHQESINVCAQLWFTEVSGGGFSLKDKFNND